MTQTTTFQQSPAIFITTLIFTSEMSILLCILTLLLTKENEISNITCQKVMGKKEKGFSPLSHASFNALLKQSMAVSN